MSFFSRKGGTWARLTRREEKSEKAVYPLMCIGRLHRDAKTAENAINNAWQTFIADLPPSITEFQPPVVDFKDSGEFLFSAAVLAPLSAIDGLQERLVKAFARHNVSVQFDL